MNEKENISWNPFKGHKYMVSGGKDDISWLDDPVLAIEEWFRYQKSSPTDVAIFTPKKSYAEELVKTANSELLRQMNEKYGSPYKLEYLIEEAEKKTADNCRGFYENEYGYGDTIHPFGVG